MSNRSKGRARGRCRLLASTITILAVSCVVGCAPDRDKNSDLLLEQSDQTLTEETLSNLVNLVRASEFDRPSERALLVSKIDVLTQNVMNMRDAAAQRESRQLNDAERKDLELLARSIQAIGTPSQDRVEDTIDRAILQGARTAHAIGEYPWVTQISPALLLLGVDQKDFVVEIAGYGLNPGSSKPHVGFVPCNLDSVAENLVRLRCAGDVIADLPTSPVTGEWAMVPVSITVRWPTKGAFSQLLRRSRSSQLKLVTTRAPDFAGRVTIIAVQSLPGDTESRLASREFDLRGLSCSSSKAEWRVSADASQGWSIDPSSIELVVNVAVGASSRPIITAVSHDGFSILAVVDGGKCMRLPFGSAPRLRVPGRLSVTAHWKEVRSGSKQVFTDVLRDELVPWNFRRLVSLPSETVTFSVTFHRADGRVDRVSGPSQDPDAADSWLSVRNVAADLGQTLQLATVSAEHALGTAMLLPEGGSGR